MNSVALTGRLTRDPEVRYTQSQTAVATFTLAVDRPFSRDRENNADFIRITAFGKSAEFAEKFLNKGRLVGVTGRIQTGSYTNKEGQKVYTTDVVIDDQEFAESKNASGGGDSYSQAPAQSAPSDAADGFMNIPEGIDEELPFS